MTEYKVINGDSANELKNYPDNYFDSCVTDPPYGIEFLNKNWDNNTGAVEVWREVYRTLKPGAYLLAFSAPRTYHRLASNLEEIGFEIKDQIMWLYASGFPKGQNVGKMIQKQQGVEQPQSIVPTSEEAKKWAGHGTALKPAHEPIAMARKPTKLSTPNNVQEHGTGALNIDDCRVPYADDTDKTQTQSNWDRGTAHPSHHYGMLDGSTPRGKLDEHLYNDAREYKPDDGRYPSNVIGEVEGYQKYFFCPKVGKSERHIGHEDPGRISKVPPPGANSYLSQGIDVRDKSTKGNNHPTVKPKALMAYLVRLVTPKNGTVLDPFGGSGSTGLGCIDEDMNFTGIELDEGYAKIAQTRLDQYNKDANQTTYKDVFDD